MVPLDRSCFTDYSTDLPGPITIKGINGNTKVLGIGTIKLNSPNGGELVLRDVLHAPGLPYSLLSLGRLMIAGNTITFNDPYLAFSKSNIQSYSAISTDFKPEWWLSKTKFITTRYLPHQSGYETSDWCGGCSITILQLKARPPAIH